MGWNDWEASQVNGKEIEAEDEVAGRKTECHRNLGRSDVKAAQHLFKLDFC